MEVISRKEAKALGLKFYVSTCKRCGRCERRTDNGACKSCEKTRRKRIYHEKKELRSDDFFNKYCNLCVSHTDHYSSNGNCKTCANKRSMDHYLKNRDFYIDKNRSNYENNKDRYKRMSRDYYERNKDVYAEKVKAWRKENPEKVRSIIQNYKSRKKNAEGSHTGEDIQRLYDLQKAKCAYCETSIKKKYHVDHVIAIKNGGSNWPSNLQLLCPSCNCSKGARCPIEHAQIIGKLL